MIRIPRPILAFFTFTLLSACQLIDKPQAQVAKISYSTQEVQQHEQNARKLIAQYSLWQLDSSPMLQAYRGLKTNYDQWDDLSIETEEKQHLKNAEFLELTQKINLDAIDKELALSIKLLNYKLKQSHQLYPYRYHNYPVNQLFGLHTQIPTFLMNIHQIQTISDAKDYIKRIKAVRPLMKQLITQLKIREEQGIRPPAFAYESAITSSQKLLNGYPFNKNKDSDPNVLWSNFENKLKQLKLYDSSAKFLRERLKRALKKYYKPAYLSLISHLQKNQKSASLNTGFHQFPNGKEFYKLKLKASTTTNLSAQQIHDLGLKEIAHIKLQITQLLPSLGESSIEALFKRTREDKSLYYQDTNTALKQSKEFIHSIHKQLGKAFNDIPDIGMEVTQVEEFRKQSAPVAFYQSPSDDGKRAGRYYMNQSKLNEMPAFEFEALAYHETIPGHHLQTIYALQNKHLPEFRRHGSYTAYSEGWALYAEKLGKELGGYSQPWNEYGRLLMELWRANRLVIDTGLHFYGWDIDKAMEFRLANTPFSKTDSLNAIQRYLVMPGQATAYKIGQLRFIELRKKAKKQLGEDFHLPKYHEFILKLGPMPMDILDQQVEQWIKEQKGNR